MESNRQNNLLIYIVPECGQNSMIIRALKTVKNFGVAALFGKED